MRKNIIYFIVFLIFLGILVLLPEYLRKPFSYIIMAIIVIITIISLGGPPDDNLPDGRI